VKEGVEMDQKLLHDIKRGLGRAYIKIKESPNSIAYKTLVMEACTSDMTVDFWSEGSKGNYLYNFVSIFNDPEYFLDAIVSRFWSNPPYTLFAQLIDLLANFYRDGYKDLVAVNVLEQLDDFLTTKIWTHQIKHKMEYLIIFVIENFRRNKAKDVISRFISKVSDKHLSLSNDFGWALSYLEKYDKVYEKSFSDLISGESKKYSIKEFIEHVKNNRVILKSIVYTYDTNKTDNIHELVEYLYSIKHDDESKIYPILRLLIFYQMKAKIRDSGLLNLDQKQLLNIFHSVSSVKIKSYIVALLLESDDPTIKGFGYQIVSTDLPDLALPILLKYFDHSDKILILGIIYGLPREFKQHHLWASIILCVLDCMKNIKTNDLDELLLFFYKNHYGAYERKLIVEMMKKKKLLTEDLIIECMHDSYSEIKSIAQRANRFV